MSDELVVVRRPYVPGLKPIRTGVVLAQTGDLYDVRWDDNGSEDEIRLGDYEKVMRRDSLHYLASLGDLNAEFAADALPVVLRVLSEHGTPVSAKEIRAYLISLGLDKTIWSSTWPKLQKVIVTQDGVVCEGEGALRTFTWTGDKLPDLPTWTGAPAAPAAAAPAASVVEEEPVGELSTSEQS